MYIKYIPARQVYEKLTMDRCIELMRQLFTAFAEGRANNRVRSVLPVDSGKLLGLMPALLPDEKAVGAKLITVFHDNYKLGLPSHQGVVAVFSTEDGSLQGICDGTSITAVRTGAVSALATDLLAGKDADTLCLLGGGVQADMHLRRISCVRKLKNVRVWCPTLAESCAFADRHRRQYPDIEFTPCENGRDAVRPADIICTVTASHTPVLLGEWVKEGAHINAVGACAAADRELDSRCVARSRFFCDSENSCMTESGDYLIPLAAGEIENGHLLADLAALVSGKAAGRQNERDITVFEALGLAAEDIICARRLLKD